MFNIAFCPGEKIVDADYFVATGEQTIHQMRAQKSGATSHQYALPAIIKSCQCLGPFKSVLRQTEPGKIHADPYHGNLDKIKTCQIKHKLKPN